LLHLTIASVDAGRVEVVLEDSTHHGLAPVSSWSHAGGGWSAVWFLGNAGGSTWLSFHREHKRALASGCATFDMLLQTAPRQDITAMTRCPSNGALSIQDLLQSVAMHGEATHFVRMGGGIFSGAIQITVDTFSFVEVTVQFNLMLSVIDLWLKGSM